MRAKRATLPGPRRENTRPKALVFLPQSGSLVHPHGALRMLPPWRLVLLKSRVASAANYPAWSVTETSRPKVLVFLRLWCLLSGITDEPSESPMGLEACGGTICKGEYEGYGCLWLPLHGGKSGSHDSPPRLSYGC